MENLIKTTPDKEKANSILKMINITLDMISNLNPNKFSSNITKEYYEIIRKLMSIIILLDGYKMYGEGSHKNLIQYIQKNYKQLTEYEILLIDELRITRNKIAYDGFFVEKEYLKNKSDEIMTIIKKLKNIISIKI